MSTEASLVLPVVSRDPIRVFFFVFLTGDTQQAQSSSRLHASVSRRYLCANLPVARSRLVIIGRCNINCTKCLHAWCQLRLPGSYRPTMQSSAAGRLVKSCTEKATYVMTDASYTHRHSFCLGSKNIQ